MKPNEIIQSLSKEQQGLLNEVLAVEKSRLHIQEIKTNSRIEKEVVSDIIKIINRAVNDAN